jgi:hypothetical protein
MFFHELGHFFACRFFGLAIITWSPTQVIHESSYNSSINMAVGFAGGLAQALSSFMFVLIIGLVSTVPMRADSQLASRLRNWSIAIGLEAAFLTMGFAGLIIAFWEGLYADSYNLLAGDAVVGVTVTLVSGFLAFLILHKVFPEPVELHIKSKEDDGQRYR